LKSIQELLEHELSVLYDAEHKTVKALARMASKCENAELVQVLEEYQSFSEKRIGRLESVFEQIGRKPQRTPCAGINGLITEFSDFLQTDPDPGITDIYGVESARRIERYAICAYQALITLTVALQRDESTELLATSLSEHNLAGNGFKALAINLTEKRLREETE